MKWITREHRKFDRIACPGLIQGFIDPEAELIYIPFNEVRENAQQFNVTAFDIPYVGFTHYKDQCTFDYFVKNMKSRTPPFIF